MMNFTSEDLAKAEINEMLDKLGVIIYWKDTKGVYLGCNQAALSMFDVTNKNEIIGKSNQELLHNRELIEKILAAEKIVLSGKSCEGEECIITNKNTKFYASTRTPLKNHHKKVVGILSVSIDVTHIRTMMELEKQQAIIGEQYKTAQIVDAINASIYWKHNNDYYLGCNRYVLNMFGMSDHRQFVGKTIYDIVPKAEADQVQLNDQKVLDGHDYQGEEELTLITGEKRSFLSSKVRLFDTAGNVIGLIGASLDITDRKKAEALQIENEVHQAAIAEQERFGDLVGQLVHDIMSPIAGLSMVAEHTIDLPEQVRLVIHEATTRVSDITTHILSMYAKKDEKLADFNDLDAAMAIIASSSLFEIIAEKRFQHTNKSVEFKTKFADDSYFAFIFINPFLFKRIVSNIINNAVEALDFSRRRNTVTIHLSVSDSAVKVTVEDNGCGMSQELVTKLLESNKPITSGKVGGHGIGMQQIMGSLKKNNGTLNIESEVGVGTKVTIRLPRIAAPNWIVERLDFKIDDIVVVLDDDSAIHVAWDTRVRALTIGVELHHFSYGAQVIDFIEELPEKMRQRVYLLADYELLKQDISGLDVIERVQPQHAVLVTSHYANLDIRERAAKSGTKILPKRLAESIMINVTGYSRSEEEKEVIKRKAMANRINQRKTQLAHVAKKKGVKVEELKAADLVIIDDDVMLVRHLLLFIYKDNKIDVYHSPEELLLHLELYHKDVVMLIDNNFGKASTMKGIELAQQLHEKGYTRLYLFSGKDYKAEQLPDYLTPIFKTDLTSLGRLI